MTQADSLEVGPFSGAPQSRVNWKTRQSQSPERTKVGIKRNRKQVSAPKTLPFLPLPIAPFLLTHLFILEGEPPNSPSHNTSLPLLSNSGPFFAPSTIYAQPSS